MSSKRGIVGTDGFDWGERFELIDARRVYVTHAEVAITNL